MLFIPVVVTLLARARIYLKHYRLGIYLADIAFACRKENVLYILMQFPGLQGDKKWSLPVLLYGTKFSQNYIIMTGNLFFCHFSEIVSYTVRSQTL